MLISFFTLEVVIINGSNHVLSKGDVAANFVTLETFTWEGIIETIHSMANNSRSALIIIVSIKAPRTRIRSLCASPAHFYDITIIIVTGSIFTITVFRALKSIVIASKVHAAQIELTGMIGCTDSPNLVIILHTHCNYIISFDEIGCKIPVTPCTTKFCHPELISRRIAVTFVANPIIFILIPIFSIGITITSHFTIFCSKVSLTKRNSSFHCINAVIINITISNEIIITASSDIHNTDVTGEVSSLEISAVIARFILTFKELLITKHGNIMPVVVHFARKEDIRTKSCHVTVMIFYSPTTVFRVRELYLTSNLDVVSVLFEFRYANTEVIEFVSKFANQSVISTDSAFSKGFGHNLSHFITGHGAVTFIGAIRITINNPSCSQFSNGCISPVASRNVGEGVRSKSGSAYAESHGHSKNQTLFHFVHPP